ncbi:ECF transporter S component [Spiroplasma attinicola]|uniref:ECF transporter S component n=1 Tax=Spiroplasma attinicola TaxID=2904537 RepID=UPI002022A0D1|nr:ECF transporter S component [Spiroplasma sp. JKS002670]MCL8209651.1 hypothetical protein [Spiroplasma sp. JKS002670]
MTTDKDFKKQFNKKIISSFKLTTHKITLIVLLLALTVLISLLEIPVFFNDFLTIDFGTTINLLAVFIIRLPYSLLIAVIAPWLRLIIPHTMPPNVVGELAYMLSSISTLAVFFLINSLLFYFFNKNNNWKLSLIFDISSAVLTTIIISFLNTFFNWAFILDLYGAQALKSLLWTLFLPYNLFKFTLIFILFCLLKKPFLFLKHHFNL